MTREDYLNNETGTVPNREFGEDVLKNHLRPFSEVTECFVPNNMSQKDFNKLITLMNKIGDSHG